MKKILALLLLATANYCSSFASPQRGATIDSMALYKADSAIADSLKTIIKQDEQTLATASSDDSLEIVTRLEENRNALNTTQARIAAEKPKGASAVASGSNSSSKESSYKGGHYTALGVMLCIVVAAMLAVLIWWLAKSHDWLKTALSENEHDKETKVNPQYSALAIMQLMASAGAGSRPPADQAAIQTAVDNAKTANDAYETARTDEANAETATYADEDAKKKAKTDAAKKTTDAKATLDTKLADLAKLLNPATVSPVVMNSLIQLFPPTIDVSIKTGNTPIYRPSASRLLAFLSGILLLFVALMSTCFYVYFYLVTGDAPDLTKLTGVLIALGIGLAPYAVNKVANAASNKDKTV